MAGDDDLFPAWLAAFNDSEPRALADFLSSHGVRPEAAPLWASYQRRAAPLVPIAPSGPHIVEDRWAQTVEIRFGRDAQGRLRITVEAATPPADQAPPRLSWPQLEDALRAKLADCVARGWFAGAVQVSRNGRSLFQGAYGEADREQGLPNTLETRFRVGSMNKMITGVAALQLVQAGVLGLDDAVGRHLPDYPSRAFAETVTLRHLLTHTGGAGDFFGPAFDEHRLSLRDPADYVALYGARDPEFAPGSQYKYANYGFILMGRIIEVAAGAIYDDYVAAKVLGPAGMTATGALPEAVEVPRRAVGYMDGAAGQVRNDPTLPVRGTPAGGGYSTVGDLVRFAEALLAGRLLDAERMFLIETGGVETAPGVRYSMGFVNITRGGLRSFGHTGGAPGMNGDLAIFPATGYVVAALSNGDPPQASGLAEFIARRLPAG